MTDSSLLGKTSWGTYYPCSQCGGSCSQSGTQCFGTVAGNACTNRSVMGTCNYVERVSTNRFDNAYSGVSGVMCSEAAQPAKAQCLGQPTPTGLKVAPMTMVLGEGHYMGMQNVPQYSYNGGYTTLFPTWIGAGRKFDYYPQANMGFYRPLTQLRSL